MAQCITGNGPGATCKTMTPTTLDKILEFTDPSFTFADGVELMDRDAHIAGIVAGSIIVIPEIDEVEPQDFEDPLIETTGGSKIPTFSGMRGRRYKMRFDLEQHKMVKAALDNKNLKLVRGDRNGNWKATKNTDGTIAGFDLSFIKVWKQQDPGVDAPAWTIIDVQESEPDEWDVTGVYAKPSWAISRLRGALQVTATAGTISTGVFTLTLKYIDGSSFDEIGLPFTRNITGALEANMLIYDQLGALVPVGNITSVPTTGSEYIYTVTTAPAITAGTFELIASANFLYVSLQIELA